MKTKCCICQISEVEVLLTKHYKTNKVLTLTSFTCSSKECQKVYDLGLEEGSRLFEQENLSFEDSEESQYGAN